MKNKTDGANVNPGEEMFDPRNGAYPDGLYHNQHGRYMFIKNGVFHFSLDMLDLEGVLLGGYQILAIFDINADTWRYFVRAGHCVELFPGSAATVKRIVARYGASL